MWLCELTGHPSWCNHTAGVFKIPMWHKEGSVLVAVQDGKLRIGEQDWSELTIEAFPSSVPSLSQRRVFEPDHSGQTVEISNGNLKLY